MGWWGQAEAERKERDEEKRENEGMRMESDKRKRQTKKGTVGRETESAVEQHSCGEQADSAQQSKHTAGLP